MSNMCNNCGIKQKMEDGMFGMEKIGFYDTSFQHEYAGFYIHRNTVTDVLYMLYTGKERGELTEMHDPETGLPLTYKRYLEMAAK